MRSVQAMNPHLANPKNCVTNQPNPIHSIPSSPPPPALVDDGRNAGFIAPLDTQGTPGQAFPVAPSLSLEFDLIGWRTPGSEPPPPATSTAAMDWIVRRSVPDKPRSDARTCARTHGSDFLPTGAPSAEPSGQTGVGKQRQRTGTPPITVGFESRGPAFIHRSTPSPRLAHGVAVGLVWAALLSIPHWDVCNCRYAAQTSSTTVFLLLTGRSNQSFAAPDAYPALPCLAGQMSLRSPSTAYAVYVFILRDAPAIARPPPSSASLGRCALSPTTLGPRFSATTRFQIRTRPTLPLNGPLAGTRCFLDPCMLSAGGLLPRPQPPMVHQQAPAAEPVCDSFVCEVALKHGMAVANLRLNVVSTGLLPLTYPNDTSAPAKSPCQARTASKWGASAFESSTANLGSEATVATSLADLCHHPKSSSPT
ncbi:hypothetical protein CMUS01_02099 [Colletotrichum musicola]|uniref:Uncharacterized protein n=1 Tax=Colletotrichum musicola TaxID=2175873 RepID=A0A8H6NVP5_9PEZI|nr:hypothetical protein CMUS01_02099 [Colletotrichum musicola]